MYLGIFKLSKNYQVKIHIDFLSFSDRFEIEIEPLFASIALYDVKERKKVSKQK